MFLVFFSFFFFKYLTFLNAFPRVQLKCHICALFSVPSWGECSCKRPVSAAVKLSRIYRDWDWTRRLSCCCCCANSSRTLQIVAFVHTLAAFASLFTLLVIFKQPVWSTCFWKLNLFLTILQFDNTHSHTHTHLPAECIKYGLTGGFWASPPSAPHPPLSRLVQRWQCWLNWFTPDSHFYISFYKSLRNFPGKEKFCKSK